MNNVSEYSKKMFLDTYHKAVFIGKQSGKPLLDTCSIPLAQLCVTVPGTLGEPMTQPLQNASTQAMTTQYTMYLGNLSSRESII
jgi:hypothetical protein